MDQLITRLTSFFSLTKTVAITVPGMIAAAAIALLVWPPAPRDVIMVPANMSLVRSNDAACEFNAFVLQDSAGATLGGVKARARNNQDALESSRDQIQECITREKSHASDDSSANAIMQAGIVLRAVERDSLHAQFLRYVQSHSDLATEYHKRFDSVTNNIRRNQASADSLQARAKGRQLHIALEAQYLATVTERLADPGRLRPKQGFDEVWSALSNHVVAFLLFAVIVGYALDPFSRTVFGGAFDWFGCNLWNGVREDRFRVTREP